LVALKVEQMLEERTATTSDALGGVNAETKRAHAGKIFQ
jgi:hypothetical protein